MARRSNHDQLTPLAKRVAKWLGGCFDNNLQLRRRLFEETVEVCNTAVDDPPEFVLTRPAALRFGDRVMDLSGFLDWLAPIAGQDGWTYYFHHHDNIVVELALLEPYERETFCRRLNHFRTHEAAEGGSNILGVIAPGRAWLLAVENDNQGTFRIDFLGPTKVCESLRSHLRDHTIVTYPVHR